MLCGLCQLAFPLWAPVYFVKCRGRPGFLALGWTRSSGSFLAIQPQGMEDKMEQILFYMHSRTSKQGKNPLLQKCRGIRSHSGDASCEQAVQLWSPQRAVAGLGGHGLRFWCPHRTEKEALSWSGWGMGWRPLPKVGFTSTEV